MSLDRLGRPDRYGSYWLGLLDGRPYLPAVFLIRRRGHPLYGRYYVCPSGEAAVPFFPGGILKTWETAEEALRSLREIERRQA